MWIHRCKLGEIHNWGRYAINCRNNSLPKYPGRPRHHYFTTCRTKDIFSQPHIISMFPKCNQAIQYALPLNCNRLTEWIVSSGQFRQIHTALRVFSPRGGQITSHDETTNRVSSSHRKLDTPVSSAMQSDVPLSLDSLPVDLSQCQKDQLFTAIREMSLDEILTLVSRSHHSMDNLCFALCMKNVYRNYARCEEQARENLVRNLKQDLSFQVLLASVCAKAPHYEPRILYDLVTFFDEFGYSSQDFPMKVVLQLIRFGVGDLSLDQLIRLSSLVYNMHSTRETTLLVEGIKCLLHGRQDKIEMLTLGEKVLLLDIFTDILEKQIMEDLLVSLLKVAEDFEVGHAVMVLSSLSRIPYRCLYKKDVLFECVSVVHEGFDGLTEDEALEVLESVELFKQKIPEDFCEILLRVAQKLSTALDVTVDVKLDIVNKLWRESLLDVDFLGSVISQISGNGLDHTTDVDTLDVSREGLTSLLQYAVEIPEDLGLAEQMNSTEVLQWMANCKHLLTHRGMICLKQLLTAKAQTMPAWLLEQEREPTSEQSESTVTSLDEHRTVYLDGLSIQADDRDIMEFFQGLAKVTAVEILSGAAFVEFENLEDSIHKLQGEILLDSQVEIKRLHEVKKLPDPYAYKFVTEEDYKHRPRNEWPTVGSLSKTLLTRISDRAELAAYSTHSPPQPQNTGRCVAAELELTPPEGAQNNTKVCVVVIKPGQYFHNTGHLKQTHQEVVKGLQKAGCHVLVVYLEELVQLHENQQNEWIDERLTNIEKYQAPDVWTPCSINSL